MHIEIWSDVVCGWCYIGKRRLEAALGQFSGAADVTISHRSFELDPTRPVDQTINRRQMLMGKYRLSADEVEAMDAQVQRVAAADGLRYNLGPDDVVGNTRHAHELLHLARLHACEDALIERFYQAYFTDGRSIFEVDSLVALAGEVGLDPQEARQALLDGTYRAAVEREGQQARQMGATGVPFFVIDRRFGVSGAQPAEAFLEALRRAAATPGAGPAPEPTDEHP